MSFLASAIAHKSASASNSLELFREIYGRIWETKAGRTVNLDTAIQVSAVFACCRVIGNGMAQVPLKLMRETTDAKGRTRREPAKDHPLYDVMGRRPNPWQTSFGFRQTWSWHLELAGNFVAFKNVLMGHTRELIPLDPTKLAITQRDDMSLKYVLTGKSGEAKEIPAEAIFHVRGPSWDGWKGVEVLRAAKEAVGLAIVTEESQASLHKNGVRNSGVYSVEGKLVGDQYKVLREWIEREAAGAAKTGMPLILDRGAKWLQTQMSGVDAQHLETRKHQIEEVARFMGVLPIMIGYSDKATTYASSEQMFLAHLVHTLAPRWTAYEQELDSQLLTEKERADGYYFDFVEEGMIRGSAKDTADVLLKYVNGGLITPNEGRGKLDMNPDDDPKSDELREPVNVAQDKPADAGSKSAHTQTQVIFSEGALQVKAEITTPDVKITNTVEPTPTVVDVAAPIVHNHVNPAAIEVKNIVQPADVKVETPSELKITGMPERHSVSETERDAKGNITKVTQTERDA